MNTAIIIPIHNQENNITRILHGLSLQSDPSFMVYFMLDRPSAVDHESITHAISTSNIADKCLVYIIDEVPTWVSNRAGSTDIFLTPYVRNVGINYAKDNGITNFIFIDGDCIPQEDLVKSHVASLNKNIPILNIGRRREQSHGWKDQREVDKTLSILGLFRDGGMIVNNLQMLRTSMIVWSCNISMNIDAINRLERFNEYYYNKPEVFSSLFTGTWGGEDGFLGIEAYYSGIIIHMLGDRQSGIKHIDHPRPVSKYGPDEHTKFFNAKISELGNMMIKKPLTISFFC